MPQYTLNMVKCIQHLRSHAKASSTPPHLCATYVKQAMAAGGLPYLPGNGGDNWRVCKQLGYTQYAPVGVVATQRVSTNVGRSPQNAVVGDICCVYGGTTVGHMCMFDGVQWISDFKQTTCIPYHTWHGATFWRWKDGAGGQMGDIQAYLSNEYAAGGMEGQMSAQQALQNAYPVHNEYTTISGKGGNIFENSDYNSFTTASMTDSSLNDRFVKNRDRIRIYSTNDSTIVLDELSLPVYHQDEEWANKHVTTEQELDIINKNNELKTKKTTDSSTENNSSTAK